MFGLEKFFKRGEGENFKAPVLKPEAANSTPGKSEKISDRVDLDGEKELVGELLADPKAVEVFVNSYLAEITGRKDAATQKLAQDATVGLRLFLTSSINHKRFSGLDAMGLMSVVNAEFKKICAKATGNSFGEKQAQIASQIEASMREQNFRALMKDAVKVAQIRSALDKKSPPPAGEQMKRAA